MGVMAVIGLIPTVALFVVFFMRFEGKERWSLVITYAALAGPLHLLRLRLLHVDPVAADTDRPVVPGLKVIPSV